jgi:murein DD-endopeptidase MepM/ murein hydrolase activator NlpD
MKRRLVVILGLVALFLSLVSNSASRVVAQSGCNIDWDTAVKLAPGQYREQICQERANFYQFTLAAGEKTAALSDLPADYDLLVFSATRGEWVGSSENGGTDIEEVRWTSQQSEVIYVIVAPYGNATTSRSYLLTAGRFPQFRTPVTGLGEGVTTPLGSVLHRGPDTYALDYANYSNSSMDVYPAFAGRVVYSGCISGQGYGCVVVVRHWDDNRWDKKFYTIYAHLQTSGLPALWTQLDGTRPIGSMGQSGEQGSVHLHFAVRYGDDVFDKTDALWGSKTAPFDVRALFR